MKPKRIKPELIERAARAGWREWWPFGDWPPPREAVADWYRAVGAILSVAARDSADSADRVWLAPLARRPDLRALGDGSVRHILRAQCFPPHIVRAFLAERSRLRAAAKKPKKKARKGRP